MLFGESYLENSFEFYDRLSTWFKQFFQLQVFLCFEECVDDVKKKGATIQWFKVFLRNSLRVLFNGQQGNHSGFSSLE